MRREHIDARTTNQLEGFQASMISRGRRYAQHHATPVTTSSGVLVAKSGVVAATSDVAATSGAVAAPSGAVAATSGERRLPPVLKHFPSKGSAEEIWVSMKF